MEDRKFYSVISSIWYLRLPDPLENGYESETDFRRALNRLVDRWRNRVGEAVGERHGFLLLRFHDTPGGRAEEAWLPPYLLKEVPIPDYVLEQEAEAEDEITKELNKAYGFD